MSKISRQRILIEKESGNYECPHFIPPRIANEIALSRGINLSPEAAKSLAEIAENFALELLCCCKTSSPTVNELRAALSEASFD